jgi:hypothetical protein
VAYTEGLCLTRDADERPRSSTVRDALEAVIAGQNAAVGGRSRICAPVFRGRRESARLPVAVRVLGCFVNRGSALRTPARQVRVSRRGRGASLVDGEAQPGSVAEPDVVVEGDPEGIYSMFVDRRLDLVNVQGDRSLLDRLIGAAPVLQKM